MLTKAEAAMESQRQAASHLVALHQFNDVRWVLHLGVKQRN
jgi:hypothetical protein